jgi:ZIP family zinc transporter
MSFLAGVIGMGLGGLLTAVFLNRTDKMVSILLSFAGGVMISIVFLELIPVAIDHSNLTVTVIGLIIGALMVLLLNNLLDRISEAGEAKLKLHETYAEFFHSNEMILQQKSMLRSGTIMLFAIGLHNVPEGLALGAAGYHDFNLGVTLAIIIGLHNIPEGMAVSTPLVAGGFSKAKSVLITILAGSTTVVGAVIGFIIGGISDIAVAVSFAVAGGAMLYVVLGEIIPQSIVASKDRVPTTFALVGIIAGMLFTAI